MTNKELVEKLEMIAGQLALAENFHQPRKEKQYEKRVVGVRSGNFKTNERRKTE